MEAPIRRVPVERVYRDPARHGSGESAQPSGGVHLIDRDEALAGVFFFHASFDISIVANGWFRGDNSSIEARLTRESSLRLYKPPARKHG